MADVDNKKEVATSEPKKVPDKPKKPKVGFKTRVVQFLRDYKSELKKIVWCSRKQTIKNTVLVIVSIVISAAVIGGLDYAFSTGILALGSLV